MANKWIFSYNSGARDYDAFSQHQDADNQILDYDFWIRVACLGEVYIIHEPLNFFRVRNDSNTGEVMSGEKTKTYVGEHRYLMEKHAKELELSKIEIEISVLIRRLRNFAGAVYLKIFVHD